jgi:hypothetical protein
MDRVVGCKFKLRKKIGSGSFGELFLGELLDTHPLQVSSGKKNVFVPLWSLA